ncbi:helicase-related protein [Leifsonia sp. L25]|uniref:helicase-related protein n=1 Tax=Actinomycetes TaxID=1760 RepID=UPI003D693958
MQLAEGQRVRIPTAGVSDWVTIVSVIPNGTGIRLFLARDGGDLLARPVDLGPEQIDSVERISRDGSGASASVIAGLWTRWMMASTSSGSSTLLASTPLEPFAHQANAVYGAMLPQPQLRFLLADEPGTGKTIMAGLYLREAQKLGLVRRALVVAPANLVTKWQYDFERFFGGELRRVTSETIHQHALDVDHDTWIVSLELAASNASVQHAIRPDRAGWDLVIFDEAHRLTPTAATFHSVGRLLAGNTPRAVFMTATPHRGSEWLFRHLLHLVDAEIYPDPGDDPNTELSPLKPGSVHFLRRMKEDLFDRDNVTPLFRGRHATNVRVQLSSAEDSVYRRALELVDDYFPISARPLARMVYGKRAASTLFALSQTLQRRRALMGEKSQVEAELFADPQGEDESAREEAAVVYADSTSARQERAAIDELLAQIDAFVAAGYAASKREKLVAECLRPNSIVPGGTEQAVVFTEYADSAEWLTQELNRLGYSARMYSGRQLNAQRDEVRAAFMRKEFQVIVSTDAGNEGIDLQSAHVLVNYDIPWSLVRLEQRMGRIHRIGQERDVELYNLIAIGTREGETLHKLLERFVTAANELNGQMFDSLSLVAELTGVHYTEWLTAFFADEPSRQIEATAAADRLKAEDLKRAANAAQSQEVALSSKVDTLAAIKLLQSDMLDRVNPAIVEAYLRRLDAASVLRVESTATGEGIFRLSNPSHGPVLFAPTGKLIATSGAALQLASLDMDTSQITALGPGEPAFQELVAKADIVLSPDLYRGGAAVDATSASDYTLFAFEGVLRDGQQGEEAPWLTLIRIDETGSARPVRWEALANIAPSDASSHGTHPARMHEASVAANEAAAHMSDKLRKAKAEWFAGARKELAALPVNITKAIADREERLAMRASLSAQVEKRLSLLEGMTDAIVDDVRLVGQVDVKAIGAPPTPEEKDSELIAMICVRDRLRSEGWAVNDVSTEGRGYDLLATRGGQQRCVEVKGVWGAASSQGVRMTANEVLIALQQGDGYWLYVVDGCADGRGEVFLAISDPIRLLGTDIARDSVFRVPGSALVTAKHHTEYA